ARAALLEHAGLIAGRVLRRRRGVLRLLVLGLLILGLLVLRLLILGRRRFRLGAAAEQAAEQAARLLRLWLGLARRRAPGRTRRLGRRLLLLLGVLKLPLQLRDPVLRLGHRVLLHEGHLGDAVARLRVAGEQLRDEGVRLTIDRRQRRRG